MSPERLDPKKTKKEIVVEFRTSAILEAANHVFGNKGFEAATVEEIAEAAGIAKGTIYLYYPSKEAIFAATLESHKVALMEEGDKALAGGNTVEDKLCAFIRCKALYFERNRDFFRIYFSQLGPVFPLRLSCAKEGARQTYLQQVEKLIVFIRQAQAEGTIRPLPAEIIAYALMDITRGLVARHEQGFSVCSLDQEVQHFFDLFWTGVANR